MRLPRSWLPRVVEGADRQWTAPLENDGRLDVGESRAGTLPSQDRRRTLRTTFACGVMGTPFFGTERPPSGAGPDRSIRHEG
jgi:hypothetical protein